jgi:hypothetical protein
LLEETVALDVITACQDKPPPPEEAVLAVVPSANFKILPSTIVLFVATVNSVTPFAWSARFPELSAVVRIPVIPEMTPLSALIVEGIFFP